MEGDVVLAHEVVRQGLRVIPPLAPRLGVAAAAGPLDGRGQVADDGVEPHVEALVRVVDPAVHRHWDAPIDVAGDGTRLHLAEQALGEVDDVSAPAGAAVEPGEVGVSERRQVEEVVLGGFEDRGFAVDFGLRIEQVGRVELVAAGVALVAAGAFRAADRACALNVAVRQGAACRWGDGDLLRAFVDVAVLEALAEHVLDDLFVVAGRRAREEVVAQAQVAQVFRDDAVVTVGDILRGDAFLVGFHQDRGAVLVRARDHQDIVALHALVPGEYVGRDAEARDMPDVSRSIGIRPGNGNENVSHGCDYS